MNTDATNKQRILDAILTEGRLNSYSATYTMGIKQAPARINGLNVDLRSGKYPDLMGKRIIGVKPQIPHGKRDVDWILSDTAYTPVIAAPVEKHISEKKQVKYWDNGRLKVAFI